MTCPRLRHKQSNRGAGISLRIKAALPHWESRSRPARTRQRRTLLPLSGKRLCRLVQPLPRSPTTAIIISTKGTTLSTVLAGVKSETESHPNYKRTEPWKHESGARFVLHQPGDANRELLLTVLIFDVPA